MQQNNRPIDDRQRALRRHTSLTSVRHGPRQGNETNGLARSASGHSLAQNGTPQRPSYTPSRRGGDLNAFYQESENRHKSLPVTPPRRPPPPVRDGEHLQRSDPKRKSVFKSMRRLIRRYFGITKKAPIDSNPPQRPPPPSVTANPQRPWMRENTRVLPTVESNGSMARLEQPERTGSVASTSRSRPMQRYGHHLDDEDSGVDSPSTIERQTFGATQNGSRSLEYFLPCIAGIFNHGNTCYINSILQCLAAADPLAEYFVTERYAKDLEDRTSIQAAQAREFGTSGALTRALASMLQALWFNQCGENMSSSFKSLLGQFSGDYRSFQQQDAQEFLVWLLDKVHEDLNTSTKRTYRQPSKMGSEEDLADATLQLHRRAHCSVMTELFEAQSRSSIFCTACHFSKLNFEPYICTSLPVPQDTKKPLFVIFASLQRRPRLTRFGLNVECNAKILDVKQCIAVENNIPTSQLMVSHLSDQGLRCVHPDRMDISALESNQLFVVELSPISLGMDQYGADQINVVFCMVIGSGYHSKRHGEPFSCLVSRQWSYEDICRQLLDVARPLLARVPGDTTAVIIPPLSAFRIRVVDDFAHGDYLDGTVTMPLFTEPVDRALSRDCKEDMVPSLRLNLEWMNERFLSEKIEPLISHNSCDILNEQMKTPAATILHCIQEYTRVETLNEWRCENCGERKLAEKHIKFRTLPQIIIFHLKRFRHLPDGETIKLDREVQFPLDGLDLSPFVYHSGQTPTPLRKISQQQQQQQQQPGIFTRGGFRGSSKRRVTTAKQAVNGNGGEALYVSTDPMELYDLFAVVNHRGESINSGHYTAIVRNPLDGRWRLFDDTQVIEVGHHQIVSPSAYLLFYERRSRNSIPSVHSSSESGFGDHWMHRLPGSIRKSNNGAMVGNNGAFRRGDASRRVHSPTRRTPSRPGSLNVVQPQQQQQQQQMTVTCSSIETDL